MAGATALALGLLAVAGAQSAPSVSGLIAFARSDGIYAIRADGTGLRLLRRSLHTWGLEWSPDGRKLAYVALDAIWVIDADGNYLARVSTPGTYPMSPTWSPDGLRIAYTAADKPGRDIWVVNGDGTNVRRLARTPGRWEAQVDWSPSGRRLAVATYGYPSSFLYVMDVSGRNVRRLTPNRGLDPLDPEWSPSGQRIAYAGWTGDQFSALYLVNPNTGKRTRLTSDRYRDHGPTWSPDGRLVAFVRGGDGVPDVGTIHVMRADGSGATRLARGGSPAWQPAGLP